jgi:hypothetical protein
LCPAVLLLREPRPHAAATRRQRPLPRPPGPRR